MLRNTPQNLSPDGDNDGVGGVGVVGFDDGLGDHAIPYSSWLMGDSS